MEGDAIQKDMTGAKGTPLINSAAITGITPQEQKGLKAPTTDQQRCDNRNYPAGTKGAEGTHNGCKNNGGDRPGVKSAFYIFGSARHIHRHGQGNCHQQVGPNVQKGFTHKIGYFYDLITHVAFLLFLRYLYSIFLDISI
ncbi:MAG: hypothetical protein JRF60_11945 [Deltaproteobacteria bacterium]|nr:hypothetical protein [Deltaproteobacteria bacterium]